MQCFNMDIFFAAQIDGFEQDKKVVVIAATNRKQDLDPALIRSEGLWLQRSELLGMGF